MKISLVLVGYFSSSRLEDCLRSFKQQLQSEGLDFETIVVDHSENSVESERLQALGADVVLRQENRGYAAGLNAGVQRAGGDVLFLANPDIVFLDGCAARLLLALDSGFDVVGPRLCWDREGKIFLPPPEDPAPKVELRRRSRAAFPTFWRWTIAGELDRIYRSWSCDHVADSPSLRGPLLALRRETWERMGTLDEGYFLYFEETEWLLRARKGGCRLGLVGDALLVHEWGHSTLHLPETAAREASSRQRFYRRNYPLSAPLLSWIGAERSSSPWKQASLGNLEDMMKQSGDIFLFSPFEHLHPAAGWIGNAPRPDVAGKLFRPGSWLGVVAERQGKSWLVRGPWRWGEQ